jgi:hypothetical protein
VRKMKSRRRENGNGNSSGNGEVLKGVRESVGQIQQSLNLLQFSPNTTNEALNLVAQSLSLPIGAFSVYQEKQQEIIQKSRREMGETLRKISEKEKCSSEFRPPNAFFGCVNFSERKPNTWDISVLDDIPLTTVETVDAKILADIALEIIVGIESALEKTKVFAKNLENTYRLLQESTHFQVISANILMLFLSSDKNLKSHLISAEDTSRTSISRAQMAYLLKALKQGHKLDKPLEISFTGATQHSMKEPYLYLSLPSFLDPRKHPQPTPISAVILVVKK